MSRWTDRTNEQRFAEKVDMSGECWLWKGARGGKGYGIFTLTIDGKQKWVSAHRFAYETWYGKLPAHLLVCHRCDTPLCVNPKHLWLGTNQENILDAQRKGRLSSGPEYRTCKNGHTTHRSEWVGKTTTRKSGKQQVYFHCGICNRAACRTYWRNKQEERARSNSAAA